jgi:hypothetical protein
MNVAVADDSGLKPNASSSLISALHVVALIWFVAALIGQWIFAYYTGARYVSKVILGNLEGMTQAMHNAYVPGEVIGNLAVAAHMTLALAILIGGPLQLISSIRARFPTFHRWNGRAYLFGVVVASVAGLIMIWGRGTYSLAVQLGGTGNAVLVFVFAALALRAALSRDFVSHRRWALRLFIAGSAVWFFRVILMAWVMTVGPVGIDFETASGPFLDWMAFGQYLIPLVVLEGYLRAKQSPNAVVRYAMAVVLGLFTLVMCGGIVAASMGEWLALT